MSEPSHFNPRSPCGERHLCGNVHLHFTGFQSTLSLRRATTCSPKHTRTNTYFNPRSPCGERPTAPGSSPTTWPNFNPRSPCGERPGLQRAAQHSDPISIHALLAESDRKWSRPLPGPGDFNPRSPCGERRDDRGVRGPQTISIHALLAESDVVFLSNDIAWAISIHALLAESDGGDRGDRPAGGGISIHALLAESDLPEVEQAKEGAISIHALLAESDAIGAPIAAMELIFQSTLSLRRATSSFSSFHPLPKAFQSTLSLRRATPGQRNRTSAGEFQSTLSLRRATGRAGEQIPVPTISIHALLAESDAVPASRTGSGWHFNPRSPCGERPRPSRRSASWSDFNPRSPCGERQQIPPNWPYRFCLKCQFKDGEKSKKAKGSASAQASSPAYEKNKVRIPWGDFECFRFAPIK